MIFDDKFVFVSEFIKQFLNGVRLRIGGQSQNIIYIALHHLPRTFVEQYYLSNTTAYFVECVRIVLEE